MVLFKNTFFLHNQTCWQSDWQRRAQRNCEEPALKLLASRQEPVSSLDKPAITQTHLPPITHTHTQVKYIIQREAGTYRNVYMTSGIVTEIHFEAEGYCLGTLFISSLLHLLIRRLQTGCCSGGREHDGQCYNVHYLSPRSSLCSCSCSLCSSESIFFALTIAHSHTVCS